MKTSVCLLFLLVTLHQCFFAESDDQSLIDEIFAENRNPAQPDTSGQAYQACSEDGRQGECVPYYLCSENKTIIENGEGVIDIRFNEDAVCADYLTACCFTEDILTANPNTGEGGGVVGGGGITGGGNNGNVGPVSPASCGVRNAAGLGFKIKGAQNMEAEFGEFTWMTAILSEEEALGKVLNVYKCGGSLIHPQVVLTGAHCIHDRSPDQLKVRLGEWDTQTTNEPFPHVDVNVAKKVVHDGFNPKTLANNIGLLFLAQPVILGDNINTVCLPPQGSSFDGSRCFASGWGKDQFGKDGKYQVILKKIELPVVSHQQCQAGLRTTRLGRFFKLHESFMCAGGEPGKDTCRGDGGSPLVCPSPHQPGHYFQAGIVSWGIGCGEAGVPGVYANVAKFRNWIDTQVSSVGFNAASYSLS